MSERTLARLTQSLKECDAHPESDSFRDSVMIRFVFTYELMVQVLFRYVASQYLLVRIKERLDG